MDGIAENGYKRLIFIAVIILKIETIKERKKSRKKIER